MTVYIYALEDHGGSVRYVGRTRDPELRLQQHKNGSSSATSQWALSGELARMSILEELPVGSDVGACRRAEKKWIKEHESTSMLNRYGRQYDGEILTNLSVRLPPEVAKRVRLRAAEDERKIQDILAEAIVAWLDRPRARKGRAP